MSGELDALLRDELREWSAAGLTRELPQERELELPARGDFRSNDYLGLARDERVVAAARAALEEFGAGGRAARLLGGGSPLAARAERSVAEWLGVDSALLFPSGFQANLGVIGALAGRGDAVFSDELNHASLVDGCRLSRAQVHVHRHRDLDELAAQLARARGARRRLVVTETLFSMDGDLAPLVALHELCERFDAWLVLDEAHAIGLLGPQGAGAWAAVEAEGGDRGSAAARRAAGRVAARTVTGGKALGVGGAFVAGSAALRDTLLQKARAFVFTTAPPPAVAGALITAVAACQEAEEARRRALGLARRIAATLERPAPDGAIVPIPVGDATDAVRIGAALLARGFAVGAVRPPTVPHGSARLRIVTHAFNDDRAADELATLVRETMRRPATAATAATAATTAQARAKTWFIVGTDTGVGKTVVSALLLRAARRAGGAIYWKPVQTGADDDTATVRGLAEASEAELRPNAYAFALPASPHEAAAAAGARIDPDFLAGLAAREREAPTGFEPAAGGRVLLVELAGGLLVPYRAGFGERPFLQADWLAREGARVVLVARSGLGTLNHTLLTLEALRARHLEPEALFLVGEPHASNAATLHELAGVARILEIPRFAPLAPTALERWIDESGLAALFGPAP